MDPDMSASELKLWVSYDKLIADPIDQDQPYCYDGMTAAVFGMEVAESGSNKIRGIEGWGGFFIYFCKNVSNFLTKKKRKKRKNLCPPRVAINLATHWPRNKPFFKSGLMHNHFNKGYRRVVGQVVILTFIKRRKT